jgi:hypothetical protein
MLIWEVWGLYLIGAVLLGISLRQGRGQDLADRTGAYN